MSALSAMPSYATPLGVYGDPGAVARNDLPIKAACPPGKFIQSLDIESNGNVVGRFKATCNDGTVLRDAGAGGSNVMGGFSFKKYIAADGWDSIKGYTRGGDISLLDSGLQAGSLYNATCPAGTKISGYDGWSGWWLNTLRFYCSPLPDVMNNNVLNTSDVPSLFNSLAKIFLSKGRTIAPLNVTAANKTMTVSNASDPIVAEQTSVLLDDGTTIITTLKFTDGSSASATTVKNVTTNDTGMVASYNALSTTDKTIVFLGLLLLIVVIIVAIKKSKPSPNTPPQSTASTASTVSTVST